MSSKKVIGAHIALSGESEYRKSIANVTGEMKKLDSASKLLSAQFTGQANTMEALQAKQELLTKSVDAHKKKEEEITKALKKAEQSYKDIGNGLEKLLGDWDRESEKLTELKAIYGESSDEVKKQEEKLQELSDTIKRGENNYDSAGKRIQKWETELNKAKTETIKANEELDRNEKYLKEAETATDHCATSIDAMGKEVKQTEQSLEKFGDTADEVAQVTTTLGDKVVSAFVSKGTSLAVDTLTKGVEIVKESMYDASAASTKLAASTGASEAAAKRYQSVMLKVKGNNFGEDYNDVSNAIAAVIQNMGELDDVELQGVTQNAISLRDTFGYDYQESIRAADMLMNQFGITSQQAFNLIVQGSQQGLNKNGDLLDVINEYSVHYAQMGVSAEGFFNSLANGTDAGTFSVDKLGDAYKEFGIRVKDTATTTDEAYKILGLDADAMRTAFAEGGDSAAEATNTVLDALMNMDDKVKQNQAGVDLFGTMWEDLGIEGVKALTNLEGEISSTKSAMDELNQTRMSDLGTAISGLGSAIQEKFVAPILDHAIPAATDLINGITKSIDEPKTALQSFLEEIQASNEQTRAAIDNAQATMDGATADVAELETYKQVLMELNEQESLTEFQKYQLASAVETLSGSVPGLAEAFNAANGTLLVTNEELETMFSNAETVVMQTALIEAQKQSYEALAQATLDKAKADSAVATAQEAASDASEKNLESMQKTGDGIGKYFHEARKAGSDLTDALIEQEKAANNLKAAQDQIDEQNKAFADAGLYEQFGIVTDAAGEASGAINETGKTLGETARIFDEYGNDITGMSEEQAAAVTEASQKIVDAYTDMRDGIADSIKGSISLFDEFSGGAEISAGEINDNLESQITGIQQWSENMKTLAGQIGQGFSQELYDELAAMGPEQSATAVQALVDALNSESGEFEEVSKNWSELLALQDNAEAIANATTAGKNLVGGYVVGMTEESEQVVNTTQEMAQAAVVAAENEVPNFQTAGSNASQAYTNALKAAVGKASQAGGDMARAARDALNAYQSSFYTIGFNLAAGASQGLIQGAPVVAEAARSVIRQAKQAAQEEAEEHSPSVVWRKEIGFNLSKGAALGILDGQKDVMAASRDMAKSALDATKAELGIHSPSKIFKEQVGAMITEGVAFGISSKASLAGKAAAKMSNKVYTKAVSWLAKYKKSQQASLDDEEYYWKQVLKHVKKGTTAYNNAAKKLGGSIFDGTGLSGSSATKAAKKIADNFGVSKYTKSGKKKTKKSDDTYYSEIYSAAEKYLSNMQVLNDWSLEQELAYWNGVKEQLKSGTQAWYDATKQINSLQADIAAAEAKAAEEKVKTHANVQKDILDKYKVYYKVSAKAEMDYWNLARQQFKKGTDERIEADQNYLKACQEYYDQRKELDEEYAENSKDINEDLSKNIQDLQDAYHDAVQSRKQDILSSMNLFESWDASGYDSDTLLYNLKTQVAGLALWEQQLEELGKKGLSDDLMEELRQMGPDAAANIYSLNQMTAEQLDEYNKLWEQKNALAHSQALKDNEDLLKETNSEIINLRTEAQAELNALNADYRAALQELNTGISSELRNLVNKAGSIGEEAVSSLIAGIGKEATSVDAYNSTTQVVNQISSQLGTLKQEGKTIGASALDGLLAAMRDNDKINSASKQVIQSIKRAMEEEAEIHSPARLFRRETGPQIPAGVALGMEDGTKVAVRSAQEMMQDTLAAAQEEMRRQQAALQEQAGTLSYAGIARLNRLTEQYPQQTPVVNVDNSGLMGLMERLITNMDARMERLENMQVVIDDTVIGVLQPKLSRENAMTTVRANRGRRR